MTRDELGILRLWVATDGDDANSGDSASDPKKTLASLKPLIAENTIVTIAPGVYEEKFVPAGSSALAAPVVYRGVDPYAKPVIKPVGAGRPMLIVEPNITIENLCLDGISANSDAVKITYISDGSFARNIRLSSCEIRNAWHQGVLITGNAQGVGKIDFVGCTIQNSGRDASASWNQLHGMYVIADDVKIDRCKIVNSAGYGIVVYTAEENSPAPPRRTYISHTEVLDFGTRGSPYVAGVGILRGDGHGINDIYVTTKFRSRKAIVIEADTTFY